MSRKVLVRLIVCHKCKLGGGTLRKVSDGRYEHVDCPVRPLKNRAAAEVPAKASQLFIPAPEDLWKMRKLGLNGG